MWVRSPLYDGVWILSGLPLAIAVNLISVWGGISYSVFLVIFVALFDTAHNISPMYTAWSHAGFRRIMLQRPTKFILLPISLLGLGLAVGVACAWWRPAYRPLIATANALSVVDHPNEPFAWLLAAYLTWNAYHFAMQNFGVLSIYRRRSGVDYGSRQRTIDLIFSATMQATVVLAVWGSVIRTPEVMLTARLLTVIVAGGAVACLMRETAVAGQWWTPRAVFMLGQTLCLMTWPSGVLTTAVVGFNHWLTAIGLSSHVVAVHKSRSPARPAMVLIVVGLILFVFLFSNVFSWDFKKILVMALPCAGLRMGLGFYHFLQDRWVWRLSDPQVRATIGRDLFGKPNLRLVA